MKNKMVFSHPGSTEWEAVCQRCGRCCYEKIDYRGRIYYTKQPCQHLDSATKLCRVYRQRDECHADCSRLTPELVAAGILPKDCPYVVGLDNYQAPEMETDEA